MDVRPNKSEELFLSLAYNRFYDIADEIMEEAFWEREEWYRFSKVSHLFAIYAEVLSYEPIKLVLKALKKNRPPMESEIGGPLFKFVRNILAHFPLFESWNDVWINKELVNWQREGLTIDRFLKKYSGHEESKFRFWEPEKELMTYISIRFPQKYDEQKIYLREIISEKDGVKFSVMMMKNILNSQVESIVNKA
ncbi:hypothetical protein GCM10007916_31120 [Psychromonas marina]|uniref:Uncharacterized protein n=1 Tax=Psychromonas marina TaxID=88364 RepID=A0ABQ6E3U1_9GAMM|nr:hypothetical protein [Psychromonas marina]GLS92042.1 hypothetical protein GCM10007916_31120 [Psychromonas marina]